MKNLKNKVGAIVGVITVLTSIVLLFPVVFDNQKLYSIVLYSSIVIVVAMLLFLIWVNVFAPSNAESQVPD